MADENTLESVDRWLDLTNGELSVRMNERIDRKANECIDGRTNGEDVHT